jgi:hypothetical protein
LPGDSAFASSDTFFLGPTNWSSQPSIRWVFGKKQVSKTTGMGLSQIQEFNTNMDQTWMEHVQSQKYINVPSGGKPRQRL